MEKNVFKLALLQMTVSANKQMNLQRACSLVKEACSRGAQLVSLPESFTCPIGKEQGAAEEIATGESMQALSQAAKDNNIFLIGGTIPEKRNGQMYNTATVFSPQGTLLSTYSKVHLFDIDIPGKITFKESEKISPGNQLTILNTPFCKVGLGICYDVRFPELASLYRAAGCKLLIYPAAFNTTTGPAHWELLARARALDTQCYVAMASSARDTQASYVSYGHSLVVNPWGEVIAQTDESDSILYADIDLDRLDEVREMIPISKQQRSQVYNVCSLAEGTSIREC